MSASKLEYPPEAASLQAELFLKLSLYILTQRVLYFRAALRKLPVPLGAFALSEEQLPLGIEHQHTYIWTERELLRRHSITST
jgi:hypothetical protein